jgi:hypothetical protein
VSNLTPTEGARYELERDSAGHGDRAEYRVSIFTPSATHTGRATLALDGTYELAMPGAPEELVAVLAMFVKLTARAAAGKRDAGIAPWPARVLRWRGPGRGE